MITNDKGLLLHGISRNKIAAEVAIDENDNTYAGVMGTGKPGYFKLMQTANQFCAFIKRVFVLHVGISRNHIQDYLNWACLRQRLRSIKPRERKDYVLKLCASTKISYKRPRKKSSAHRI